MYECESWSKEFDLSKTQLNSLGKLNKKNFEEEIEKRLSGKINAFLCFSRILVIRNQKHI